MSALSLEDRIQSLPQELQDDILDRVLDSSCPETVRLHRNYKPPWQLQFNRRTRKRFARIYYSHIVILPPIWDISVDQVRRWFRTIEGDHRSQIKQIKADSRDEEQHVGEEDWNDEHYTARNLLRHWASQLKGIVKHRSSLLQIAVFAEVSEPVEVSGEKTWKSLKQLEQALGSF